MSPKTLFIRMDKIGDLCLRLALDQLTDVAKSENHWMVSKGLGPIVELATPAKKYSEFPKKFTLKNFLALHSFLRKEKFTRVVNFYSPKWVAWACALAGIPVRVGRLSSPQSYLFFNQGVRQKRSLSEKHESEYGAELVAKAFELSPSAAPFLKLNAPPVGHLLEKHHLRSGEFFVVHPGMAGSALNWPQENYNILIEKLINLHPVVITGTPEDEKFLSSIRAQWGTHENIRWLQGQLQLKDLVALLAKARAVVAPSTGVLHLAAATGVKCVGIYCPVLANHPRRWGPRGTKARFVLPKADCPAKIHCIGSACSHHPCMDTIRVNEVLHQLEL